jgi:hypothetical protein
MEPGVEAVEIAQATQVAPRLHQRLLDGIVGEVAVAEHELGDVEEPADRGGSELSERCSIASPRPLDQVSSHQPYPSPGAVCAVFGLEGGAGIHLFHLWRSDLRFEPPATTLHSGYPRPVTLDRVAPPRCNIGPDEIAKRRRSAILASAATAVIAVALVALEVPAPLRLLLWPIATAAAVTWLQVIHRFCVAFGALGLENFGRLGEHQAVDARTRATDRRRAFQLILEGGLIGLIVTLAVVAIPV